MGIGAGDLLRANLEAFEKEQKLETIMTYAEYKEQQNALEYQRVFYSDKIKQLNQDWVDQSPFKIGDKVEVISDTGGRKDTHQFFIRWVSVGRTEKEPWEYSFSKIKADGTESKNKGYVWRIASITLLERPENS